MKYFDFIFRLILTFHGLLICANSQLSAGKGPEDFLIPATIRLPPRPAAPILYDTSDKEIIVVVFNPHKYLNVSVIESQYRPYVIQPTLPQNSQTQTQSYQFIDWISGPNLHFNDSFRALKPELTMVVASLAPNTEYEIRIRVKNNVGYSSYSIPLVASTRINITESIVPATITFPSVSSNYIDVSVAVISKESIDASAQKQTFILQYQPGDVRNQHNNDNSWITYPNAFQFYSRLPGIYVQSFSSRAVSVSDSAETQKCVGYFWLKLPNILNSNSDYINMKKWLITTIPLKWDTTAEQFLNSIKSIGLIKYYIDTGDIIVSVVRNMNVFNGYTWTVSMSGNIIAMSATTNPLFPFNIYKHTLSLQSITNQTLLNLYNNSNYTPMLAMSQASCWPSDPANPILTKVINNGHDIFQNGSQVIRIPNLLPNMMYSFRLQVLEDNNQNLAPVSSNTTNTITNNVGGMTVLYSPIAIQKTNQLNASGIIGDPGNLAALLSIVFKTSSQPPSSLLNGLNNNILQFLLSSAVTISGYGIIPGNPDDYYYQENAGVGGVSGQAGGHGYCVGILQESEDIGPNDNTLMVKKVFNFPYIAPLSSNSLIGTVQTQTLSIGKYLMSLNNNNPDSLNIPSSYTNSTSLFVTFKCWGGGGGGGKVGDLIKDLPLDELIHLSMGGGAGYAQITVPVRSNDVFHIQVGGGGQSNEGELGGRGGLGNGGNGYVTILICCLL